jgi:hypothetical protein
LTSAHARANVLHNLPYPYSIHAFRGGRS